jgi:hypothetical protein
VAAQGEGTQQQSQQELVMPKTYITQRAEALGLPIVDSKEYKTVTVTQTDIVKAKKTDSKHCAFARAALRIPKVNAAYFLRSTAYLEFSDRMERYKLPLSAQKEIVSFDRARVFAPGVYTLTPPPPSLAPKATTKYRKKPAPLSCAAVEAVEGCHFRHGG